MKKFLALYMAPIAAMDQMMKDTSVEDMKKGMEMWEEWMEEHKDHIIEMGDPLGRTKRVSPTGVEDIRNEVGGYSIVQAESHDEAAKLFGKDHPHFAVAGATVEIMEIVPMPLPE